MTGETSPRDDRILPLTRVVAAAVIVILLIAWVVLFAIPTDTDTRFAWTIQPTMTAMLMGAGYGSALYFFSRVLTGKRWHAVGLGFLPTTVFTWMMLGATFLHWDRFRHGSLAFGLWFWIYLATPVLVPAIWLRNRRRDPGREASGAILPPLVVGAMVAAGVVMCAIAAWMYLFPSSAISIWPWILTPLTARTVAAFVALPGVAWFAMAADGRWSAARTVLATVAIGLLLLLAAVVRAWDEFDHSSALSYVYVAGLAGTLAAIAALTLWMGGRDAEPDVAPLAG